MLGLLKAIETFYAVFAATFAVLVALLVWILLVILVGKIFKIKKK